MSGATAFVIAAAIAFVLGLRGSVRLTKRYHDVTLLLVARERLILGSFVGVSWIITLAGGWFVFTSARRLLGFPALDWTPLVSLLIASIVLFIPAALDYLVDRVARVPWR